MKINLPDIGIGVPVHPRSGLAAIGIGKRGPIWPVLGGAEDDGDGSDGDDGGDDDQGDDDDSGSGDDDGADKLGDAGKQALDRMKAKVKATNAKNRELVKQLADAQKPAADGDKVDPDKIRAEAKAEAQAETLRDRALDKVEAKAAKLFADPEDARALLASSVDDFIDDGAIDIDAIGEALEELLKKKPHLAAQGAGKRFGGGADGGARNGPKKPDQYTEADLKKMTPLQIHEARKAGKLADLL